MSIDRFSFMCGAVVQGFILGIALAFAIMELANSQVGTQIFRYQGF